MSNYLPNGTVLPHGLLGATNFAEMGAFNKTYKNTALRMGIVISVYPTNHKDNFSKVFVEHDVLVLEQNENTSSTPILFKNCTKSDGVGAPGDFFEKNLRPQKTKKNNEINTKGQNGAIVLLMCLDGISERAIIVGCMPHPDRETTLIDENPHLEGEYNGVNIQVDSDGATRLIFKGATDNDGKLLDSMQGPTTIKIEKDGSFQMDHKTIKLRLDKQGDVTLKATGNINITAEKDATVTATGDVKVDCKNATVTATGDATLEGKTVKLGSGANQKAVLGDILKKYIDTLTVSTALGPSGPPILPLPLPALSNKVKVE